MPELPTTSRERTLPNGLRVVELMGGSERAAMALVVRGGPGDEPMGLPGLGALLAESALDGTESDRDATPARRALLLGGTIEALIHGSGIGWMTSGPRDAGPRLLRLLRDVVQRPALSPTRLQARAERAREAAQQHRGGPTRHARGWAIGLALGAGRTLPDGPSDATLATVERDDLVRLHRAWVVPERAVLVLVGLPREVADQVFGDWRPPAGAEAIGARAACGQVDPDRTGRVAWVAGPPRARRFLTAVRVPGRGHPQRALLESFLARADVVGARRRPTFEVIERGDAAALLVSAESPEAAEDALDALAASVRADPIGERLRITETLRRAASSEARVREAALRSLVPHAAAETTVHLRALLGDPDRRARIGVGPEDVADALRDWGPVYELGRRHTLCPDGDGPG